MATQTDQPSVVDGTDSLYRSLGTRLHARGTRLAEAVVHSSTFVALVAFVEVAIASVLLGVGLTPAPLVVALVAFAVYTVDSVADADVDVRSNPERAAYARRHADELMIAAALAYGLAVALAVLGGPLALAFTLLPGAFWVLYASDWLPNAGRSLDRLTGGLPRLKDVLLVNTAVVALGWAVALTFLPLAFAGAAVTPTAAVVFAYFFFRSFVDTELPNVRDVDADAAVGVATLPVVVGVARTRRALYAVDATTAAVIAGAAAAGLLGWPIAAVLLAGLALSAGVTSLAGRTTNERLLGVAPDCCYFVVGAAVALLLVV